MQKILRQRASIVSTFPHIWVPKFRLIHSHRLERWIGADLVERMAKGMQGFRYPVPVANVPGKVWCYDGEFYGRLHGGGFAGLLDYWADTLHYYLKSQRGGFASHSAHQRSDRCREEATGVLLHEDRRGCARHWRIAVALAACGLASGWRGRRGSGTIPTNATTGSFLQKDAAVGDTTWRRMLSAGPTSGSER